MNLASGVSLGQLLVSLGVMLVAGGVAWGSLLQRVRTLEKEVAALAGFGERLARIEEQNKSIKSALDQVTGSWLFREPPSYSPNDFNPPSRRRPPG